jgi:predicted RecB family nuclease
MQLINGRLVYSATDLVGYLACHHLTTLDRAVLYDRLGRPRRYDDDLDVLRQRGTEHEQRYLRELEAKGKVSVDVRSGETEYAARVEHETAATLAAMAQGVEVIYQGTFFDGTWLGHPDFLVRVDDPDRPSKLGTYHYEVVDTKLARTAKAGAILQICSYVDQLTRVQGVEPTWMYVALAGSAHRTEAFRVADYMAYYRAVRRRFEAAVKLELASLYPLATAPDPVEHCDVCRWDDHCKQLRRSADHLSLVAGITSRQRRAFLERGIRTLSALGRAPVPFDPPLDRAAVHRVREQARIQLEGAGRKVPLHELLPLLESEQGLASLPTPSYGGDLFFDIEGDPYAFEDGLDYLFGVLEPGRPLPDGAPTFHAIWSKDDSGQFSLAGEKRAFEELIDLFVDRLAADPSLHIYHYAPYEPTAIKRLMGRYGTREKEVDALLRAGVFVDLYRAVRQGVRASVESYSIKRIEPLYGFQRDVELKDATSSIVAFEKWLQLGPEEHPEEDLLEAIACYNRDDVVSTWWLRRWLERQRDALIAEGQAVQRPLFESGEPSDKLGAVLGHVDEVAGQLTTDVPIDPQLRTDEQHARWLLAQLLSWHRREDKSTWWRHYQLIGLTDEERMEAKEALGGLQFEAEMGHVAKSTVYRYRFPPQDHELKVGQRATDPATDKSAGIVVEINDAQGWVELKRGNTSDAPHPTSIFQCEPVDATKLRESLIRIGEWVAANGIQGDGPYRAGRDLLLRTLPRFAGDEVSPGQALCRGGEDTVDAGVRLGLAVDHSVLPVQGPPGAGKTYLGEKMIAALLRAGRKVGITANSHKVITNLLERACCEAEKQGLFVQALQKAEDDDRCTHRFVKEADNAEVASGLTDGSAQLVGGTPWLWSRPELAESVDVLFVDEAGQMCLANALAVSQAAKSLVLLGDPLQLDQPTQGVHPPGVAVSALGHLLGELATLPPERGLFLERTWRMHPVLCDFTSTAFYEGKLSAEDHLAQQFLKSALADGRGTGPLLLRVPHVGRDTDSAEEAAVIAELACELVDGHATWIDEKGVERPIRWDNILIVAAYNAQVATIKKLLPSEARVGTVDKFQGQEAPIAFYSMASSTAEDAPRGMAFLYSRHRLNVATSRARCMSVVVCSPELFEVRARTPREMRLANALCQFMECADALTSAPATADA